MINMRVARGAALLDEKRPGWWRGINPQTLDVSVGCDCVLGQLYGSFKTGLLRTGLGYGLDGGRARLRRRAVIAATTHGFYAIVSHGPEYRLLTRRWLVEIDKRVTQDKAEQRCLAAAEHIVKTAAEMIKKESAHV